jgi:hypothetical protein
LGLKAKTCPSKSSLSEFRANLSFTFFKDIFEKSVSNTHRETYKGFYIYATDGDQIDLPASEDVLANGYRGYPTSRNRETHYPKMYTAQVFDVINNIIKDFKFSNSQDESHMAQQMALNLEKNSITLYDRLYCGFPTFLTHLSADNYFIVRARSSKSGSNRQVLNFLDSNKDEAEFDWNPAWAFRGFSPIKLRMIKVINPRNKTSIVFITNLRSDQISSKEIEILYQRRWSIEVSFRDLTQSLKLNQLHSKTINGILQEVYAIFWFVNQLKYRIMRINPKDLFKRKYSKPNFKLCCEIFIENLKLLIQKKNKKLEKLIDYWALRTYERRQHLERSYPRTVKHRGREYALSNVVPRRLTERH